MRRTVETAQPAIDRGKHQLILELPNEPVRLDADPVRLSQIVSNLLHSAAKFTEPGGVITVKAEWRGGVASIKIIDNGVGITPEALPGIFDRFMQAGPAPAHAQRGLGVGLGLVKSLVELHGGAVEAQSEGPGRGSAFILRLPLADACIQVDFDMSLRE